MNQMMRNRGGNFTENGDLTSMAFTSAATIAWPEKRGPVEVRPVVIHGSVCRKGGAVGAPRSITSPHRCWCEHTSRAAICGRRRNNHR
jgi:hypothetical protein